MLNISQVILMRTDSNLCRKELTVHWSAFNSLIWSHLQPCTNSIWGDESGAVAPIIWLYQIVDLQKEEVFFPDLLITLRSYGVKGPNFGPPNESKFRFFSIWLISLLWIHISLVLYAYWSYFQRCAKYGPQRPNLWVILAPKLVKFLVFGHFFKKFSLVS